MPFGRDRIFGVNTVSGLSLRGSKFLFMLVGKNYTL